MGKNRQKRYRVSGLPRRKAMSAATMMAKSFEKDPYFSEVAKNKAELAAIMRSDISECLKNGDAIAAISKGGRTDGIALGFKWSEMKTKHPDAFAGIFDGASAKDVRKIENVIAMAPKKHRNRFVYIPDMAVRKGKQGRGICTALVKELERKHRGRPFIADCSNPISCRIFEKEGWVKVCRRNGLIFMVRLPGNSRMRKHHGKRKGV